MEAPFFYDVTIEPGASHVVLNEETSRHVLRVLRMKEGEELALTNGKGNLLYTKIESADRKNCIVRVLDASVVTKPLPDIRIAISLVKNSSRFEWFLEKATEIGVSEIIPLVCERTEKQHYRESRLRGILVSSILQSRQTWIPSLRPVTTFRDFIQQTTSPQKFIAHCVAGQEKIHLSHYSPFNSPLILIGPEGDFSTNEISAALEKDYLPVSLGDNRLRTETAGIVAAALLRNP